jgi:NitT/TauT family transport system ATP-binding protein
MVDNGTSLRKEKLVVSHVGQTYDTKEGEFTALDDVNLEFNEGGFACLLGPSGCGKSTLLRIIANIITPTTGEVRIFGMLPQEARQNGEFGFVFQDPVLLPWRTALKNVEMPMEALHVPKRERTERAQEMLKLVGLEDFGNVLPANLSGGMARRVAIARALVLKPRVLFLDEPFSGLDELRRRQMNEELQRIWQSSGTTALLVTHNVSEAVFLSDDIFVMAKNPGHVLEHVPIELERPRNIGHMRDPLFQEYEDELTERLSASYRGDDYEK